MKKWNMEMSIGEMVNELVRGSNDGEFNIRLWDVEKVLREVLKEYSEENELEKEVYVSLDRDGYDGVIDRFVEDILDGMEEDWECECFDKEDGEWMEEYRKEYFKLRDIYFKDVKDREMEGEEIEEEERERILKENEKEMVREYNSWREEK